MGGPAHPVLVVGAGPTGLAAASLLSVYGVPSVVVDRAVGVHPLPRAVHLDDEVCRVLATIGVAEQFGRLSRPALGLRLLDARHRVLASFDRGTEPGVHGYPQANMFDQPDLERALRAGLADHPLVTLREGVEVVGIDRSDAGTVVVRVVDAATGERQELRGSYLLGCDGAGSAVRAAIGVRMRDYGFEQRWLVVDVRTDRDLRQWEGVQQVCDPRRAATYMRVGQDRYRWEFRLRDGETAAQWSSLPALRPLLRPWTGDVDGLELLRVAEYTFRARAADRWRDGRVFLLGDAAHLTPPFIGQGLGSGLRDAANIAWKLAGVLAGTLPEDALDSYQQERRPHVVSLIRTARLLGVLMTEGGRAGDALRRLLVPRLALLPGVRTLVLDSATPRLRGSLLLARRRAPGGLVGRLCPNAVLPGGRFDDVVGPAYALVTVSPPTAADRARVTGRVLVEAGPGSELHDWLRRGRAGAALVRPDRTVMRTARSLAALLS